MLALVGVLTLSVIIFLLVKGKSTPIVIFSIIPIISAIILGFGPAEIGEMVDKGLGGVWKTAVLFIFSVSYFGLMNDVGLFDSIVNKLITVSKNNIVLVTIANAIIGVLGHLDGATATTVLITIPAMQPIYKRMNIKPEILLLIVGLSMGIMNLVPWGGPIVRVASVLEMDVTELWHILIPFQIAALITTIAIAAMFGIFEKRRIQKEGLTIINVSTVEESSKIENETENIKVSPMVGKFNLILTVALIFLLTFAVLPSYLLFMLAMSIAYVVNFPDLKKQREVFKTHAGEALEMSATLLAAGVFIGIINNTGMLDAMVNSLIAVIPESLGKYINIISAIFSLPVGSMVGADTFYYGVFPILGEAASRFGVPALDVGVGMLIGKNVGMIVSPLQPTTYLAVGLAGIELKDHLKYNFWRAWIISLVFVAIAIIMGLIKIYV